MSNINVDFQTIQRISELCSKNNYLYVLVNGVQFDAAGLFCINIGGESKWYDDCCYTEEIIGGKYGCINLKGEIQIPAIFDKPIKFNNPYTTIAEKNGKRVFINTLGNIAFNNPYDDVSDYIDDYCVVKCNYTKKVIDPFGSPVTKEYQDISVCKCWSAIVFIIAVDSKYGVINTKGKVLLRCIYDEIHNSGSLLLARRGTKCIVFTENGKRLLRKKYDDISIGPSIYRNGSLGTKTLCITDEGETYLLGWDGVQQTPKYKVVQRIGVCTLVQRNNKFGVINYSLNIGQVLDGKEIIPCKFDSYHVKRNQPDKLEDIVFINFEGGLFHCFEFRTTVGHGWDLLCRDYFKKGEELNNNE